MSPLSLFICLVFSSLLVEGREYKQEHSFRPPFTPGSSIPFWTNSGGAELANKYIKFNPRTERQGFLANGEPMQAPGWESRVQTWTGGPGEAGYSLYMSNSNDAERIKDGTWEGVSVKILLLKGSQNEQDSINIEVNQKKGKTTTKIADCSKTYRHNPNVFIYFKYQNQQIEVRYAYESVTQYFDCLSGSLVVRPGYFIILSTNVPSDVPVDRQDLYAMYTYPLEGSVPPEDLIEAPKPHQYVAPKPSNFLATLNNLLQARPDKNIPQGDLVPLYNEFFQDIKVIDEQHEYLKQLAASIKEMITQLQFEQEEEHDFFENTLSEVLDEAATGDDLRELLNHYLEMEKTASEDDQPSIRLAKEVAALKEIVTSGAKQVSKDLDEFGNKLKVVRNNLDVSHDEHRNQINQIDKLTRELSKTVESNSSFGFWVFFSLFQFSYFLAFLWWAKMKTNKFKKGM